MLHVSRVVIGIEDNKLSKNTLFSNSHGKLPLIFKTAPAISSYCSSSLASNLHRHFYQRKMTERLPEVFYICFTLTKTNKQKSPPTKTATHPKQWKEQNKIAIKCKILTNIVRLWQKGNAPDSYNFRVSFYSFNTENSQDLFSLYFQKHNIRLPENIPEKNI